MAPQRGSVIFLDDRPSSIASFVSVVAEHGLKPLIVQSPIELGNLLEDSSDAHNVRAIVLDMHLSALDSLAQINLPDATTARGLDAGLVLAESYLRRPDSRFREIPIAFLSAYHATDLISRRIEFLRTQNEEISFFNKADHAGGFRSFLQELTSGVELPPFSFGALVKLERPVPDGQLISVIRPVYNEIIRRISHNPDYIYQIDPRVWEEIIAAAYVNAGFDDVILTPRSGDLGRDVIAVRKGLFSVKFIEQIKAYSPAHLVTADEVRSLLGVLSAEQDASKAIFTTTSGFAPRIRHDRLLKPFLPHRLELIDREGLLARLIRFPNSM